MKILVAVDNSKSAYQAYEQACRLVKSEKDELHIISVWDPIPYYTAPRSVGMFSLANKQMLAQTRRLVNAYKDNAEKKNIKPYCVIATGEPGPQICSLIKERSIDLLVLGREGMSSFERMVMGSVSEYCCKHAACSVMVMKFDPKKYEEEIIRGKLFLQKISICETLSGRPPVTVNSTDNVKEALQLLAENNLSSLPVYDETKKCYFSFIDMAEIVNFAISLESETNVADSVVQDKFERGNVMDLAVNCAARIPFMLMNCEVTLYSAVDFMYHKNIKRIAIEDEEGQLVGILTQSQILKFVLAKVGKFDFGEKTLSELGLAERGVYKIDASHKVKDAFKELRIRNVTGIAVVENSKIIGNFSVSDFKFALHSNVRGYLNMTISDFIKLKPATLVEGNPIPSPICVQPSSTINEVLEKFRLTRVHRMYVVNTSGDLVGVISLRDLINLIMNDY